MESTTSSSSAAPQLEPLFSSHRRPRRHPRSRIPRLHPYDDSDITTTTTAATSIPSSTYTSASTSTTNNPFGFTPSAFRPRSYTTSYIPTPRRRSSSLFASASASTSTTSTSNSTSGGHYTHYESTAPFSYQPPKKRRLEEYSQPQDGSKQLKLSLAFCDGGTYEAERYRVGNVLVDDETVYCTEKYSCNLVLQHETRKPFTLERLEIKAPPQGFTSPVSEGVIAVTDDDYNPVVRTISMYGRMIPLSRSSRRRATSVRYRVLRERDGEGNEDGWNGGGVERDEDGDGGVGYLDGETVTEFDVLPEFRTPRRGDLNDDDDKDEEEEVYEVSAEGPDVEEEFGMVEEGDEIETDGEVEEVNDHHNMVESEDDDGTETPISTTSMPWPPMGSRSIPRSVLVETDDSGSGNANNQNDCPYDLPGEEEAEAEVEVEDRQEEEEGDSSDEELRQWLLRNNSEERRRRRRRREEEEEAEREYAHSEPEGEGTEAYMRFQIHDNRTLIVFNPPRYCKSIVLKLWGSKIDNVDIQSILGYGYFGMRVFPAAEMR
ncbi:hypothetical protein ABW19_dt0203444 [Dactylella cylindrospora]|nr:hypothetical protein ABW19_dt0203444 [Dactylella cylindrospora]